MYKPVSETKSPAKPRTKPSPIGEAETPDLRFADPLVAQIVEGWKMRQDFVRAKNRLVLQVQAICRRFCDGDKDQARKLYAKLGKGEGDPNLVLATAPLLQALAVLEKSRADQEKALKKMAKGLAIYPFVQSVKGFGDLGLVATVGECGDLSAYKSVSAVWKRCGLAVIDGERQRRVSGDAALEHGFAPSRRAVFWTLADAMLKSQGKDETAGPYRQIYDARKAYDRARVETDGHAHNRATRFMFKRFLRDLTAEWKRIAASPEQKAA